VIQNLFTKMSQLEIEYFWPLTEQIKLDLDYTPSEQWIADWRKAQSGYISSGLSINGNVLSSSLGTVSWTQPQMNHFVVRAEPKNVGKWEITSGMFVYRPTKPNALIRHMAKYFFGFKWHDEI